MTQKEPLGGLWAWAEGKFYAIPFNEENAKLDHVTWFIDIGLPDYGPPFDAILRGRMLWDWVNQHYALTFYSRQMLPNQVYDKVNAFFNKEGLPVLERAAYDRWI